MSRALKSLFSLSILFCLGIAGLHAQSITINKNFNDVVQPYNDAIFNGDIYYGSSAWSGGRVEEDFERPNGTNFWPNPVPGSVTLDMEGTWVYTYHVEYEDSEGFITGDAWYTVTYEVGPASTPATFSFGNLTHTYDGNTKTATVSPNPGGATYTADLTKGPNAGTYTVSATANGSYSGSGTATLTINKASPSLNLTGDTTITAGGSGNYSVSGGTGNYSWGGTSGASGSGNTKSITFPTEGTYTVTVSDPGDANYNASNASINVTVNPATIPTTFVFGNLTHTYDGNAKTATVTPNPGGANYSADLTKGPNAGSYNVTASANYPYTGSGFATLTINPANQAPLAASGTPNPLQFGETATLSTTGGSGSGAVSYTLVSGSGSIVGNSLLATGSSGTVTFYATKAAEPNYNVTNSANATVTLTRRQITVTAPSGSKTYDGSGANLPNPTVTGGTLRAGDTISFSGNTATVPAAIGSTNTVVGTITIRDAGSADITAHYDITPVSGTFSVTKANQTIIASANPASLQFGESATLSTTGGNTAGPINYTLVSGSASIVGTTLTATGSSGNAIFYATIAGDAFYNAANSANVSVTLNKRAITVTAPSGSKMYDASGVSLANPTVTNGTLRTGDTITFSGNTTSLPAAPGTSTVFVGTVTIRDAALTDVTGHYSITTVNGSYTVLATPPNITVTGTTTFGSVRVSAGAPQTSERTFTVSNSGQQSLTVSAYNTTGDFTVTAVNGGPPSSFSVGGGSSGSITVTFDATAAGARTGTLTLTNNSTNEPNVVLNLSGNGEGGNLTISWGTVRTN